MPNGRGPAPSSAPGGKEPSAGTGDPSGGAPGTVSSPAPAGRGAARPDRPASGPPGLDRGPAEHLLADLIPFLPSPGHPEQPAHHVLVTIEGAHRLGDGDPLGRAVDDLRDVPGADGAL